MSARPRMLISMGLAMVIGLAYLIWLAWAEGWRLWVVIGVMVLVAVIGGAAHLAMGLARARDGLERAGGETADTEEEAP